MNPKRNPDGTFTMWLNVDGKSQGHRLSQNCALRLLADLLDAYQCRECGLVHPNPRDRPVIDVDATPKPGAN